MLSLRQSTSARLPSGAVARGDNRCAPMAIASVQTPRIQTSSASHSTSLIPLRFTRFFWLIIAVPKRRRMGENVFRSDQTNSARKRGSQRLEAYQLNERTRWRRLFSARAVGRGSSVMSIDTIPARERSSSPRGYLERVSRGGMIGSLCGVGRCSCKRARERGVGRLV